MACSLWNNKASWLFPDGVCPAIRRFVEPDSFQTKMIAVGILKYLVKDSEGFFSEVFRCRNAIQNDRLVVGNRPQEVDNRGVSSIDKEGVIPEIDNMLASKRFDFGKVDDHSIGGVTVFLVDVATQRDFERVAMTVQVTALALVVGDTMTRIKLKAASDLHGRIR